MEVCVGNTLQVKGYGTPVRVRVRYGARGGGVVERVVHIDSGAITTEPLIPVDDVRFIVGGVGEKVYEIGKYGIYCLTFLERNRQKQIYFVYCKEGFRFLSHPAELLSDELARCALAQQ